MQDSTFFERRRALLGAGVSIPFLTSGALAQEGKKLQPIEDFFRYPTISNLTLAPGGKKLVGRREINGRYNAVVIDLTTRKSLIITNFTDRDIGVLTWISPERIIFSVYDRSRSAVDQADFSIYAINADASGFKALSGVDDARLMPLGSEVVGRIVEKGKWTDDILIQTSSMQARGKFSSDLYRLNTVTLRKTLLTLGGPKDVRSWVVDTNFVARAAVSVSTDDGSTTVHYRDSADAPWRQIFHYANSDITSTVYPLTIDANDNLYVSANAGNDIRAIYRFDAKKNALDPEPIASVKGYDLDGGLIFDRGRSRLIGVGYEADRPGVYWIAKEYQDIQTELDRSLPGHVNRTQLSVGDDDGVDSASDSSRVLVASYSDREPVRYFLYELKSKQLTQVGQARPWIKAEAMRPTTFYHYTARDGLSIPAHLTLPEGKGPFPLVVLHYGGPHVRPIHYGWDSHVQFLASRGYAVFMPAPRMSTGFGAKLFKAGWKQWGLAMQDDVADGVRALIKDGTVDAKRVCISGVSYGGYMTMMGLVKEPELYKCGINWCGVTDPSFMFTVTWTDFNAVDAARFDLPMLIGDPDKDAEQFKRTSPVVRAAEIKQPVLMAYGGLDRRVPIVHGEKMRDALKPHNKNVEWVVYPDEGHGWSKLENNIDFWSRVERFLATNL